MNRQRRNPGPVPNRWLHCPRKATELIIGKFMAMKTPLNENFDGIVPLECRFHPKMLFDSCKAQRIKFGLWIDLTNTTRFYDKGEVEQEGCKYVKLQCKGHGETPSEEQTHTFISLVHNYIAQHPLEAIAVHCTHGFNRTGFLIVSYLIEKMDCALEIAMDMFAKARPPGIYKADYIQELYRRYDDVDEAPPPPAMPDWCFEDNGSDAAAASSEFSEQASTSNHTNTWNGSSKASNATFMEGVPGVTVFTQQPRAFHLQKRVQVMCEWKKKGFPGCQPVSMDLKNINLLHEKPYKVSWKADGNRYMMLIDGPNEVYFFDRDHNVFKVNGLTFPYKKDLRKHLKDTLLDGEMVIDKVDGKEIPRYLAYDIIKFDGQDVGKTPFTLRLYCLENEIVKPRYMAIEKGMIDRTKEPFSVRKKEFWDLTSTASLLGAKFAAELSHEPDGLIFQPAKEPYTPGRCFEVLKWKPLDMNSVDFRLKVVREEGLGMVPCRVCYLYVQHFDMQFGKMKYTKAMKDLDNKIVECKYEDGQWKFMRERTDKSFPNSYQTALAVCESIKNPVTKEKLLEFIDQCRFEDDSEMMPPPSKKIRR